MMDLALDMTFEQTLKVSPTLIAVNQILALSSQELQAAIKQEAEENPALEITERHTCAICGEVLNHGVCANCSRRGQSQEARPAPGEDYGRGLLEHEFGSGGLATTVSDDEFDPVALVASEPTMRERLMNDLRSALPKAEHPIADYLVGNLDERGFLMT